MCCAIVPGITTFDFQTGSTLGGTSPGENKLIDGSFGQGISAETNNPI